MFALLFIKNILVAAFVSVMAYMIFVAYTNYAGYLNDPQHFKPSYVLKSQALPSNPGDVPTGLWARVMSTPCAQEDSNNCYWNAQSSGNGRGHSFYAIKIRNTTCVIYWHQTRTVRNYCVHD